MNKTRNTIWIIVEGSDGVGKTTFIKNLYFFLTKHFKVIERPINTVLDKRIDYDKYLVDDFIKHLNQFYRTVKNIELFNREVWNNKENIDFFILDRGQASFYAYNMSDKKIDYLFSNIYRESLNSIFYKTNNIINIYLDCDVDVAMDRIKKRSMLDDIESKGIDFQKIVKERYQECFKKYQCLRPHIVFNTNQSKEEYIIFFNNLCKYLYKAHHDFKRV